MKFYQILVKFIIPKRFYHTEMLNSFPGPLVISCNADVYVGKRILSSLAWEV